MPWVFRMKGWHTSEAIFEVFHGIMTDFGIESKVVRVVSDNAANMKKAFTLSLYQPTLAEVEEQSKEGSESQELAAELADVGR